MNPLALQVAIFEQLQAPLDGMLANIVTPDGSTLDMPAIYDHVPDLVDSDSNFPYVVVGDDTAIDFDTDTSEGSEATVTIHIWSRFRGRSEVKQIQRAIYTALHKSDLIVDDRHTVDCYWEYSETVLDEDGITRQGIMRFRIITEEA